MTHKEHKSEESSNSHEDILKHENFLETATGSKWPDLQKKLFAQLAGTLCQPDATDDEALDNQYKAAIGMLVGIAPRDEIEGMLAVQMAATHSAAMECLRRSMIEGQTFLGRDSSLKHAAKLLSIYTRQVETLNKYRGKGQQKVVVEYVNVEASEKAVVGQAKASRKAVAKTKRDSKLEPNSVPHDPDDMVDLDVPAKQPVQHKNINGAQIGE